MPERKPHRLPSTATPEHYEIRLTPDLSAATFDGEETVSVEIHEPVREVRVNAAELKIPSVTAHSRTGARVRAAVSLDDENEQAIFTFPEILTPGRWELQIKFSGILNDKLHGFYRSTYKSTDGQLKTLASTQFESTDARRAFPCWDEPACKAVFQITLVIDESLTAISNAGLARETRLGGTGKKEMVFRDTIKMSSYLVAFIVGDFQPTDPVMAEGMPLRVWAVPGKRLLANFALEIGTFSIWFFSHYYNIAYPGDKLDLIAIPDFASGAMENFGAITFRETALLVDESRATRAELERVADVVSHENAHMWFGDLVTMRWWNGLWLNEAFATFMEMLAVNAWKPEWRRWESFTVSRAAAMQIDGLESTRPIEFPVEKPEEAAGMFDVLTYEKGASVLRMLEQYLGAEAFRDGIRLYLQRHAYANAETTDLWDALEDSTGQPVRALMDTWIFQAGYPLIHVKKEAGGLVLSQRMFRYLEDGRNPERQWHVPILLRAKTNTGMIDRVILLTDRETRVEGGEYEWVAANAGGHGFYRVRYSPDLMAALQQNLRHQLLPVERFGLLNDTWATTLAGLTSLPEYLSLLDTMRDETDLNVWTTAIGSAHHIHRIVEEPPYRRFAVRLRAILLPALERLGWAARSGESELDAQLRGDLIAALGTLAEDNPCQERARALHVQFEQDAAAIDPNLVPALLTIVAHTGTEADYEDFYSRFKNAQTPQEEQRYLFALANFRRPNLIDRALQLTINGEVRTQNAPYLMRNLLLNRDARHSAWTFLKTHWEEMVRQYPDNSIPRMCEGIIGLVSRELETDVKAFFAGHPVKQGAKQLQQHQERLHIAVLCKERWNSAL